MQLALGELYGTHGPLIPFGDYGNALEPNQYGIPGLVSRRQLTVVFQWKKNAEEDSSQKNM